MNIIKTIIICLMCMAMNAVAQNQTALSIIVIKQVGSSFSLTTALVEDAFLI